MSEHKGLRLRRSFLATMMMALALAIGAVATSAMPARADANASTDDKSVSVPTGWWTYTNVTAQFIADRINENGARLTDIEVYDAAAGRYSVVMVRNSGAYVVPAWWWFPSLSYQQVVNAIDDTQGRLIDIDPYVVDGVVRYAIVLVSNTGASARAWWWLTGVSSATVGGFLPQDEPNRGDPQKRLVDLESYWVGSTKLYTAVFLANIGGDAKTWQWWLNQTPDSVSQKVSDFGGRIVSLQRQADGSYNFIQVRNAGSDNKYWRFYFGLPTMAETNEVASQYNTRVLSVETYVANGERRYDSLMMDNVDAETRRVTNLMTPAFTGGNGLPTANFGFYVKQVGGTQRTALQQNLTWEPASSIKAVHNLATMRSVQNGESLLSSFTYYNYPNSPFNAGTKDACPIPGDEVAANQVTTTLDAGKDAMMTNSDNRTTRGVVLRYGLAGVQNAAAVAGMTSTTIDQDQIGCAFLGGKHNFTTLVDMGRLYERVENGTLLGTGNFRTEYFQPMNAGVSAGLSAVISAEAAAQGKSAFVNDFVNGIRHHAKGGSYNVPCNQVGCVNGFIYVRTNAGRLALPTRTNGVPGERVFVYGTFVDNQYVCNGCSTNAFASAQSTVNAEMFRAEIRSALLTW